MLIAKTLSSYLARQVLVWCGGVFGIMLSITFLLDYLELIRRGAMRPEATLGLLLRMAMLKLPHMAQEVLPFGILFGTMLAFWRLTRSNELVVARAAGVSVWQFLMPAELFALVIGVIAVTVFNPVASAMQASFESLESRVLRGSTDQFTLTRSGLWLRETDDEGNQRMLHAERSSQNDIALENVTILFFHGIDRFSERIDAKEARLLPGHWEVSDGVRWQNNGESEQFDYFQMTTQLTPRKIQESFAPPETMSFWDLPGFIHLLEISGFSTQRHRLYFNALLARPFLLRHGAYRGDIQPAHAASRRRHADDHRRRRYRLRTVLPVRHRLRARPFGDDPGGAGGVDPGRHLDADRRGDAAPSRRRLSVSLGGMMTMVAIEGVAAIGRCGFPPA